MLRTGSFTRFGRSGAIVAAVAATSLALAGTVAGSTGATHAKAPIKIGVILPYTGPFGLYGKPMEATIRARFQKVGNKVAGHPIQLLFEDEATDPKTAVLDATKLATQDHVKAIVCCVTGGATLAVGPILAQQHIPQLGPIPNPSGLEKYSTAAMAAPTAGHDAELLGRYVARKLKDKTAVVLASDFSYGHEVADAFTKGFTAYGGKVTKSVYAPLGTTDFGSYLTQVGDPDVVFGGFAGADAIGFVKQYRQFGVKAPLVAHGPLVTELVLKAIGPAAVGVNAAFYYSSTLQNAANASFVKTMKGLDSNFVPSHFTAGAWTVGTVLINTIKRMNGNVSNGAAFAKAIRKARVQAPWGLLTFDPKTGYGRAPTYFYKVVSVDGTLQHQILAKLAG